MSSLFEEHRRHKTGAHLFFFFFLCSWLNCHQRFAFLVILPLLVSPSSALKRHEDVQMRCRSISLFTCSQLRRHSSVATIRL